MKNILTSLSLFILSASISISCAQEIYINPFQIQANQLTIAIWGVTSVPNAQYELAIRYKNQPWTTVQSTTAPIAGTGFIGMHNVAPVSSLQHGDVYRAFGTLVDATIIRTCTVIYKVRKRYNIEIMNFNKGLGTDLIIDLLPKGGPRSIQISSAENTSVLVPDLNTFRSEDNISIIDIGNGFELYKTTEEELLHEEINSIHAIRVFSSRRTISFENHQLLNFTFHLINANGKEVSSGNIKGNEESSVTEPSIASGVYFLTLQDEATGEFASKPILITD